jgi:3-isopropylmalate dehydrogenase
VTIVCLPGDGIGQEVMAEAVRVLRALDPALEIAEHPLGAGAIASHGDSLPPSTLAACEASDAVLMGAVGAADYDWQGTTPEDGMFALRRALDVYANLRPFRGQGIDLLIVRELVGGLYFGERGTRADGTVYDTCEYHPDQVERVIRRGFELARGRRRRLTSVDKANVLATSRLWRETAERVATEYPDVALDHLLVDTAAMHLVQKPQSFDVIVTENTFGDIISDVAAGVCGGLGLAASACIGDRGPGLFEPVHGTAPDIAGRGIANPTAMLLSTALMLRYGLDRPADADALERAVATAWAHAPTADGGGTASTSEFGRAVATALVAERDGTDREPVPARPGGDA